MDWSFPIDCYLVHLEEMGRPGAGAYLPTVDFMSVKVFHTCQDLKVFPKLFILNSSYEVHLKKYDSASFGYARKEMCKHFFRHIIKSQDHL